MLKSVLINLLLAVLAVGAGVVLSQRPWQVYRAQQNATDAQLHRMHLAENQQIADIQLHAKLDTSIGREELARKQGWKKPGEVPLTTGQ
jgi:hypothetical protein